MTFTRRDDNSPLVPPLQLPSGNASSGHHFRRRKGNLHTVSQSNKKTTKCLKHSMCKALGVNVEIGTNHGRYGREAYRLMNCLRVWEPKHLDLVPKSFEIWIARHQRGSFANRQRRRERIRVNATILCFHFRSTDRF